MRALLLQTEAMANYIVLFAVMLKQGKQQNIWQRVNQ